jgi:hypothetical protein
MASAATDPAVPGAFGEYPQPNQVASVKAILRRMAVALAMARATAPSLARAQVRPRLRTRRSLLVIVNVELRAGRL